MKILYYNWVQFDDDEQRGGGVTVYQKNLMEALTSKGEQADFISSGLSYSLYDTKPHVVQTSNIFEPHCRTFSLVNSPILSAGHCSFGINERLFESDEATKCFLDFIDEYGPYDVIHFNNIEGIPFTFLDLKKSHPDTLVVVSHHNYYAICPQVNLWHQEREHCTDFAKGRKCEHCLPHKPSKPDVLASHQLAHLLKTNGYTSGSDTFIRSFSNNAVLSFFKDLNRHRWSDVIKEDAPPAGPQQVSSFYLRRQKSVELMNSKVDLHLAVSQRVARILSGYGVATDKVQVSYIGTKHAEKLRSAKKRLSVRKPGYLSVCYLGYMRADKGFFFFLESLERISSELAARLHVTLAAKSNGDPSIIARIDHLRSRFASVNYVNGYKHDDLPKLLSEIDLGVVPVLWEDNLPQVALEIVSHGIPILTADKGGAQEIAGNTDYVFETGSHDSLNYKIEKLAMGQVELNSFWSNIMDLPSMDEHVEELTRLYSDGLHMLRSGSALDCGAAFEETPLDESWREKVADSILTPTISMIVPMP